MKAGVRGVFLLTAFALVFSANDCGGGGAAPPPPSPTITGVTISPQAVSLETSVTQQFTATVTGTSSYDSSVQWPVNDISGGSVTAGTITSAGLYTAPDAVPDPETVTVTVQSAGDVSRRRTNPWKHPVSPRLSRPAR